MPKKTIIVIADNIQTGSIAFLTFIVIMQWGRIHYLNKITEGLLNNAQLKTERKDVYICDITREEE